MDSMNETSTAECPKLDADRAAWLKDRLYSFADLVRALGSPRVRTVTADDEMRRKALEGAVYGQAREIARLLGYSPGENLK